MQDKETIEMSPAPLPVITPITPEQTKEAAFLACLNLLNPLPPYMRNAVIRAVVGFYGVEL
jgi:hypothetical protein